MAHQKSIHYIANALSHMHGKQILCIKLNDLSITTEEIALRTGKDSILVKVIHCVFSGCSYHIAEEQLKPYYFRKLELSVENGFLLWGLQVIISS